MDNQAIFDNDGRRLGIDRLKFSYDDYGPERRSSVDRRSDIDRRCKLRKKDSL